VATQTRKPPNRDLCHGWPWSVLAIPHCSQEEVAIKIFSPDDPIALRPMWKINLFWLFVAAVIVLAVAS
jgi:hypothetical protein